MALSLKELESSDQELEPALREDLKKQVILLGLKYRDNESVFRALEIHCNLLLDEIQQARSRAFVVAIVSALGFFIMFFTGFLTDGFQFEIVILTVAFSLMATYSFGSVIAYSKLSDVVMEFYPPKSL
ncbi:MAG: hypothetical protein KC585_04045 [Candidatus Magasanikbacteria bacterium]|nr:hypothetical protein [Candidatus Magasanikbacteria bacterium]USN52845.1 MAG: hypothetical protein H6759_02140 [Candidatus Nomurabacteria bacterium]